MNEQFIISRAILIANYTGIAVSFFLFLWFEFRPAITSFWKRFFAGYAAYYVTFVLIVHIIDRYITYRVYTFDHDGDQVFQDHELVGELGFFWDAMILDAGRNFAPFTGIIYGVIIACIGYGLAFACGRAFKYFRAKLSSPQ
ncbi:hypothetical protein RMR16_003010 [Agrobacterium sp. rho-13.3]|jgi:hypothetical protein|uniref:hypothetical protein n=1 Tax=Agrobacterium sp. rho-13.3 TaxID=3072980 RepID=UPI002A12D7DA|nr:hypothetical protein [Agrobacterium sp. rho-13.3]MDX8308777.1 hypothetical protein [Agrobacterium sp. rho-13.3]